MKKYRVNVDMIEHGYVDVEAPDEASEAEIRTLADEECQNDGFRGVNSHAEIGKIILNQ